MSLSPEGLTYTRQHYHRVMNPDVEASEVGQFRDIVPLIVLDIVVDVCSIRNTLRL